MHINDHARAELVKRDKEMIPKVLLRAMLFLVLACLGIVIFARVTDRPLEAEFPQDQPIMYERTVTIVGDMSGAAKVYDADGTLYLDLPPEEGGFVAGMMRALARERGKVGVAVNEPVRIVRFADGHIGLRDNYTEWRAEIIGFGRDNTAAFVRILETGRGE